MINGIGSYTGYQSYLQTQSMRSKPLDKEQMFNTLDTDGDGKLSQTELETWASTMAEKTGQTIDTSEALSTYDTDGDGGLSSEEMQAYVSATMRQGMGGMGMMQGPPPPPEGQGLFGALDTDGSGGVSESELSTWATNMSEATGTTIETSEALSTYDTDADGELSATELRAYLDEKDASYQILVQKARSLYQSLLSGSSESSSLDYSA